MTATPALSIVIPIYNEEGLLAASVAELCAGLDDWGVSYEVILAENGSRDRTRAIADELVSVYPHLSWFHCPTPNYGAALRAGIARARGEYVICEEIDLCDHHFHRVAFGHLQSDVADFVIGSKAMVGARDRRPFVRRAATRVYNGMLRALLGFHGTDTHGLKAFRRELVAPVVDRCIVDADVFASELVIRSERSGIRMLEVPIQLAEKRPPTVHLFRRVPRVLRQVTRLVGSIRFGVDPFAPAEAEAVSEHPG